MPTALQNDLKLLKSVKEQLKRTEMYLSLMKQNTVKIQNKVKNSEDIFNTIVPSCPMMVGI